MIANLIQRLNALEDIDISRLQDQERRDLLQACDRLKSKLESPMDITARLMLSGHQAMAIRLSVDLKIFDAIAKISLSTDTFSVHDLYNEIGHAEPLLIARLVRFLSAMSVVKEVDRDVYAQTPLAAAFVSSSLLAAAVIHGTYFMTILSKLPEYFHVKGWKSPGDAYDGPFNFTPTKSNTHYFDFLSSTPYYGQAFNAVMGMSFRRTGKDWFEFFPTERLQISNESEPLVVDIGGGNGNDLKKLKTRFPCLSGKLILQDLPAVIECARDLQGIEVQSHDFFQVQPVRNAKVYFMRTVLHDWPDKQGVQILRRIRDAMGRDSILLISELILPESGVLLTSVLSDMQMMGTFSSLERTQEQWRALFEKADLQLVKVWLPDSCDGSPNSLAQQPALFETRLKPKNV
ncbi:hypothetical protein N7495_005450 [Penicillium taxi]|uniref:uncharacterized protein n=1 Tax=Penicillium taxi TaxID=168475 RepID=UPI0025450501|nr:uncharacterized protein N7495_005450 [Penicillium taxi]KAJ5893759.1 hypothetical protein N7495_005450 [Penicillium taxi]